MHSFHTAVTLETPSGQVSPHCVSPWALALQTPPRGRCARPTAASCRRWRNRGDTPPSERTAPPVTTTRPCFRTENSAYLSAHRLLPPCPLRGERDWKFMATGGFLSASSCLSVISNSKDFGTRCISEQLAAPANVKCNFNLGRTLQIWGTFPTHGPAGHTQIACLSGTHLPLLPLLPGVSGETAPGPHPLRSHGKKGKWKG